MKLFDRQIYLEKFYQLHIIFVTPPPSFHLCKPSVQCVGLGGHFGRQLPCHHIRERERERQSDRERRRDCEFSMHTYSASLLLEPNYLIQFIQLNNYAGWNTPRCFASSLSMVFLQCIDFRPLSVFLFLFPIFLVSAMPVETTLPFLEIQSS